MYGFVMAQEANKADLKDANRVLVRVCVCVYTYISHMYTYKFVMAQEANSAILTDVQRVLVAIMCINTCTYIFIHIYIGL